MKKLLLVFVLILGTTVMAKNLYVRTNSDATSWSNITLGSGDELITLPLGDSIKTFLSVGTDSIVYLAPGTYNLPKLGSSFMIKTGKVYGGFSGTESTIDLNARQISDKDGNGIIEPWEFTNEAIITTSNPAFKFTGTGISSGSRLIIISGSGGELNGVTITDYNYLTYAGPICLGATSVSAANNVSGKEGILRFCTVKKIKSAMGVVMSTNKNSIIDRCLVESNISSTLGNWGGAVYLNNWGGKVSGCVIRNNAAPATSGRAAGILANTLASSNVDMDAIVENCLVYNNYAQASGGGIRGEGQASKRGIEIINCTVVNNQTGTSITSDGSVTLVNGGSVVNSIIAGDPSAELRANTTNNYVINTAYGEYATGASTLYGSNNLSGKVVADFSFQNPTLFAGVMIPDYTTPWDQTKYDAIRQANFKVTASSSVAVTAATTKTYPASYLIGGTGSSVTLSTYSIPSKDLMGVARPIGSSGHLDLGAYQYSDLGTGLNTAVDSKSKNIYSVNEGISISNAKGKLAGLYNFSGQLVKSEVLKSDNEIISVNKGLYIVKVGLNIEKVIVQ